MLIGYIRVSKSDGSQVLDLQHDAMLDARIDPDRIYKDPLDEKMTVQVYGPV